MNLMLGRTLTNNSEWEIEKMRIRNDTSEDCAPGMSSLNQTAMARRCINGIYPAAANLSSGAAFAGAMVLTAFDLGVGYRLLVGGVTMGLIAFGTFCFWRLTCCSTNKTHPPLLRATDVV